MRSHRQLINNTNNEKHHTSVFKNAYRFGSCEVCGGTFFMLILCDKYNNVIDILDLLGKQPH